MENKTKNTCSCHSHEESCHCGHTHEEHCHCGHTHEESCHCGHSHEESCHCEHYHEERCHCGHTHEEHCHCEHSHEESCGCGHSHSHSHSHSCGCGCGHEHVSEGQTLGVQLIRIGVSVLLTALAIVLSHLSFDIPSLALWLAAFALAGYDIVWSALKNLLKGHVLDENFLMSIASVGAFVLGEYFEALAVVILYRIGELFESYASDRSRRSIEALGELCPDTACVLRGGREVTVRAEDVEVGELAVVLAGGRVPFDGEVVDGVSSVDTSALTGESLPREVFAGEQVFSGCINLTSRITLRVSKVASESAASRILSLVEEASERRSEKETFIRSFAKVYTPIVVLVAILLMGVLPFFSLPFEESVYRALSFLVVSCPCALVVSVPMSIFCGIGRASRAGILIKGGIAMEQLAAVDVAAFDKTGTLTEGRFSVCEVCALAGDEEYLVSLVAGAEADLTHPIALSVCEYAKEKGILPAPVTDVASIVGRGLSARLDGGELLVGNIALMLEREIPLPKCLSERAEQTRLFCALRGTLLGYMSVSDLPKPNAAESLRELRSLGIRSCVILTGDGRGPALRVSEAVGADGVRYELMPGGKVAAVEEEKRGGERKVLFVGDGINDSPSLACADVGIAMGALGADAAIDAADAVILDDDVMKVAKSVEIAKKTMRIAKQNIFFSILVKLSILALSAFGLVGMGVAILGDVGVLVLATLNSLRAMK